MLKVKDVRMKLTASIQGNNVEIIQVTKAPNMYMSEVKMGGSLLQKEIYNGNDLVIYQMGQKLPVSEEQVKEAAYKSVVFPELEYENWGAQSSLKGIEKVEGVEAYVLEVTLPTGGISTQYYSIDTGLKMKEIMEMETPQGKVKQNVSFADYQEKNGVKYPMKLTLSPPGISATVQSLEINTDPDEKLFSLE